jgi:hypothetical protein
MSDLQSNLLSHSFPWWTDPLTSSLSLFCFFSVDSRLNSLVALQA